MPAATSENNHDVELSLLDAAASDGVVHLDLTPITGADSSAPPSEVRLLPAGTFRTTKGNFIFDATAAKSVMERAADWGNDYCFDMGHSMVAPDIGADPASAGRAYGWFKLAVNTSGELVTQGLTWTERGAEMLTKREVRYISPAIRTDPKTGRVLEFVNAALTNIPATKGMKPIVASRSTNEEVHPMETLLLALGLTKSASEAEALSNLSVLMDFKKEIVALTGKDAEESLKEVATWKARSADVATLTAQVAKMKAKKEERKVRELVAQALADKVIPPSLEEKMLETGRKDRQLLKSVLKSLKPLASQRTAGKEKKVGALTGPDALAALSKGELEVVKMLGITPEAFIKTREAGMPDVPVDEERVAAPEPEADDAK